MKNINTLLFDLDGTLVDTNEIIIRSFLYTFKVHLPDIDISRDAIINHIGPPLNVTFGRYVSSPFKIRAMMDTYREFYRNNEFAHFKLYDHVQKTLAYLNEKGFNLGIVTSKYMESARPSIEFFELGRWMDVIITLDDVENPKPSREPVDKALEHFDDVDGALMIGDNISDIEAGRQANIFSAGVNWSIKGAETLKNAKPDYMLETMASIYDILDIDIEEE